MKSFIRAAAAASLLLFVAGAAAQQDAFPSRPIKFVVPFGAGSGIDQLARLYAEELRTQFNQSVVVENREGAAGAIGATSVAKSLADGYTVLVAAHPPFAIAPQLQKNAGYDPGTSFAPVARVGAVPMVAVSASSMPFKTWQEMVAYFRANPAKANYAVSGTGSPGQLFTQLIKLHTGLPMQEISYKSTAQALIDAVGGQVQMSLVSMPAGAAHVRSGALRLLGVGSTERLAAFPEAPTLAELIGEPGFEAIVWYGFLLPSGASSELVGRFHKEIAKASAAPRITQFMQTSSITPGLQNPQQFADSIRSDGLLAKKMIAAANLQPQ